VTSQESIYPTADFSELVKVEKVGRVRGDSRAYTRLVEGWHERLQRNHLGVNNIFALMYVDAWGDKQLGWSVSSEMAEYEFNCFEN
jgi:hypothetical protein